MSGGTPTSGGGYMRQRFNQGYASSSDDLELEDDACSKSPLEFPLISVKKAKNLAEAFKDFAWIFSAVFIVYYGDWQSNMVSLLWSDARIGRTSLLLGLASSLINLGLVLYTTHKSSSYPPKSSEKSEAVVSAAPLLITLGLLSFSLFSYALWPIWSFLTIPLLFTQFMAFMVVSPYLLVGPLRPQSVVIRAG